MVKKIISNNRELITIHTHDSWDTMDNQALLMIEPEDYTNSNKQKSESPPPENPATRHSKLKKTLKLQSNKPCRKAMQNTSLKTTRTGPKKKTSIRSARVLNIIKILESNKTSLSLQDLLLEYKDLFNEGNQLTDIEEGNIRAMLSTYKEKAFTHIENQDLPEDSKLSNKGGVWGLTEHYKTLIKTQS